jgi:hypothetical protein
MTRRARPATRRRPAPRRRELAQLVCEPVNAPLGFADRVAVLLQLRAGRETESLNPGRLPRDGAVRASPVLWASVGTSRSVRPYKRLFGDGGTPEYHRAARPVDIETVEAGSDDPPLSRRPQAAGRIVTGTGRYRYGAIRWNRLTLMPSINCVRTAAAWRTSVSCG